MTRAWLVVSLLVAVLQPSASWGIPLKRVDLVGLGTHVGAAVCAGAELVEDFEHVGHGHGVALLACSKLCREINVMREAAVGEVEDLEELRPASPIAKLLWPLAVAFRLLTTNLVATALAIGALAAAAVEVLEDSRPGGHHGAVLLATEELLELLEASKIARGRVLRAIKNNLLRLTIVSGAMVVALIHTVRSAGSGLGAHHGVAVLAISKTMRVLGLLREQFKQKKE